jgi:phospholipid/cholesterol/gamma-HCH transport system substrate-binding protein
METRAHHLLIGGFAIGITFLIAFFVMWLSKAQFDAEWNEYEIEFVGSVSGLRKSADVLYNGVKVGEVREIMLDAENPNIVVARIRVDAKTPVNADSVASLESQGLTGLSAILISEKAKEPGAAARAEKKKSQPLTAKSSRGYLLIAWQKSAFQEIFADAPNLLRQGNELLGKINALVDNNSENVTGVVANAREVSAQLISISKKVDKMSESIEALAVAAKDLVKTDAKNVMADASKAMEDARAAASEGRKALTELGQIFAENRPQIRQFTKNSLPEVFFLISDTRQLIATFDRFAQRLERSPNSLFFGDRTSEYGR